ncbi:DUF6850 family outer membrane beta-barrel protein [Bacteroides pyogenes]|uniref:DUF6850 domain-containing protein n=3 Tax=Bacteroides pyogenes TaxID=310300 RepID=A0A5D3EAP1_9BACE|nr:DUF6850 family outer membrane beta-barrel protein [Bacteroides pyogenes]MBR8707457.1 hypothetical protein [Bacteroides pyogenes]MBR8716347.1 hypothetical protein [Bacteroides pyogenes]MBR8745717.1 hypothetical protein [Bacteroides pyogenes]MBR8756183.1 hypothetical protein [Bacteroides pyogenes]MBR8779327.1 hypothetical protein [Bacteroides pyogenes]
MKKQRNIVNKLGILSFACLLSIQIQSQGFSTAGAELFKQKRLWSYSGNAAGIAFDNTRNYSSLQLKYHTEEGNFCRPQEGQTIKAFNVSSEGFLNLQKVYVWGAFSFEQENKYDAGYNASITDPFRGMPYYVADTHQSNWRNQYYNLKFGIATPRFWNKITFGLKGTYIASLAAKQRDPRVDSRFYTLELTPGITYTINNQHIWGGNIEYTSIKEDSRMGNTNIYTDQDYYELYGLGVAMKGIGSGRETNYYGDKIGAGLQYNYAKPKVNLLFESYYTMKVEDVNIGFMDPRKDASIKDKQIKAALSMFTTGNKITHHAKLRYIYSRRDGIQYINQHDNSESESKWIQLYRSIRSTYQTRASSADYSLVCNRGDEYNWKVDVSATYTNNKDEYILPNSTKNSENLYLYVCGKKNIVMGDKLNKRLLLSANGGYNKNLSGNYKYGGPHPDYPTVTELETADSNFQTSDYYRVGISASYSQQYKADKSANLFAKAGFEYTKTSDFNFNHRKYLSISIGCLF